MRSTKWIAALFYASFLCTGYVIAAESTQPAPAEASKLERISDAPAAAGQDKKDCLVHHGKKECPMDHSKKDFKHGEPCPHHQDAMHQDKSHEKCDHEQRS